MTTKLKMTKDASQTKEKIPSLQSLYEQIIESAPNAIILVDQRGDIVFINARTETLFGYSRSDLIGQKIENLIPKRFQDSHKNQRRGFMDNPGHRPMGAGRDLLGLKKDGSEIPIEIGLNSFTTDQGIFVLASVIDISERKTLENALEVEREALKRSNQELEQLAYVASHDLQEPLRMVTSYVQLLDKRYHDKLQDEDAQTFMGFAIDGARRMQQLINDLLDFSRIGTRGAPFAPVVGEKLLQNVLMNLKIAIQESDAEITSDPIPTFVADGGQMLRLFQNLIANALKFRGDKSPKIHISFQQEASSYRFGVHDNGIGFEMRQAERMFQIFQRLHARDKYEGTGIGLAVCKRIVERHGGRIWAESTPGNGAVFYFTIPAKAPVKAEEN